MKIRNGFVSNSSSSSFIVMFPNKITNYQQLYDILWTENNENNIKDSYQFDSDKNSYNSLKISFEEYKKWATEFFLNEIKKQKENNYFEAISKFSGDLWCDNDKLFIYDNIFNDMDELKDFLQIIKKIEDTVDNFDWDKYSSYYCYKLNDILSDSYWVFDIQHILDDINVLIENPGIFYSFSISDESGIHFSILEHSVIFNHLPHYYESFH